MPTTARCARSKWTPYLLAAPALVFIYLFFLVPLATLLKISLSETGAASAAARSTSPGSGATSRRPSPTSVSTCGEPSATRASTTVICILLAYPLAYFIAFKVGRWRNLLLGLVMVPFFTSFLLRTIAWQSLFADNGPVLGIAETLHLIGLLDALDITTDGKILNTPPAVIGGLVYNFLPFALLPIYVSLEKIPTNLFDAASDLYSPSPAPSGRVILPMSMPGCSPARCWCSSRPPATSSTSTCSATSTSPSSAGSSRLASCKPVTIPPRRPSASSSC